MTNALIGHSGFVGSTLLRQTRFDALYRSTNIQDIAGKSFDRIICAGAPAQKWLANRNPEQDRASIEALIGHLRATQCRSFVLISTVDVFGRPVGVDEQSPVEEEGLHAYGLHRRMLEKFVQQHFEHHLIVRLPGLVGPGLKKNIIFDLLHHNNLQAIDSRAVFQFYPMVNLWPDIEVALASGIELLHLTAEPISVADVALQGFGIQLEPPTAGTPARYDMRTRHAPPGPHGLQHYQYSARETIQAVRAYAQSQPVATQSHVTGGSTP